MWGFRRAFVMFYKNLFGLLRVWWLWVWGGGERSDHHSAAVSRRSRSFNTVAGICAHCLQVSCIPFPEVNCATQTYYLYQKTFFTFTPNCYLSLSLVSQLTFSFTNKKDSKKKWNWLYPKDLISSFGKVRDEIGLTLYGMLSLSKSWTSAFSDG